MTTRDVLGLNLDCNKIKNFIGKTIKKSGEVVADSSPPLNFFLFLGIFFIFVFVKC